VHLRSETQFASIAALYGCPMFAPAYMGRKRWAKPFERFLPAYRCNRKKAFSSHVRWCERGAPVQICRDRGNLLLRPPQVCVRDACPYEFC